MTLTFALLAAVLDCIAAIALWRSERTHADRWLPAAAISMHAVALSHQLFNGGGITIGINEALSLYTWQSALLLWVFCWREPLRMLGIVIYPLSGLCAVWATEFPTQVADIPYTDWRARAHIVVSLFTAGVLTIAAVQAGALALQDRFLHQPRRANFHLPLPPLQTMERMLFQLISLGFFMLSLTLASGFWFIHENLLAQHLIHKTVLSFIAWIIFAILLWGRWHYGWRGRQAVRWTLWGYAFLILAYFGSKLVLEQILGEHWT